MAKSSELSLEAFVYQVKKELLDAQTRHEGEMAYFELMRVELETRVTASRGADGGVNLSVVRLGGKAANERSHTVRLVFDIAEMTDAAEATSTTASGGGKKKKTNKKQNIKTKKVTRGRRHYKK